MQSIALRSRHSDGLKIVSVKRTIEVEQLQFIPSFEYEAEVEQCRKGERPADQERKLHLEVHELEKALKEAKDDDEVKRLSNELWDTRQVLTDIWQQFDAEVDDDFDVVENS